jgi:PPE-repeat protein
MLWHAMPPELNTARLMAGAGPAPMLQAAAGWEALANALQSQSLELSTNLVALKERWTGAGSDRAVAAATPMVAWLQSAAQQAQQRAAQATAQAASYMKALGTTPSLPEIATNHVTHAVLTATNFLGINLVPIGFNEMDYFVRMWTQAGGAMDIYQAETAANTVFEPLEPMKPIVQPGIGEAVAAEALGRLSAMASEAGPGAVGTLTQVAGQVAEDVPTVGAPAVATAELGAPLDAQIAQALGGIGQLGQLGAPMQQLMQPLQQLTSLAGQSGGMGGGPGGMGGGPGGMGGPSSGLDALGKPGGSAQVGLLGASPLSNHPLAGGSGPSVGMGLMHAEALPGSGGSASSTSLMSQLSDKPAQGVTPAGAGAGSSAVGGAAPMGAMGQGAQSGAGARPGLAAPTMLAEHQDDNDHHDEHDEDDW